MLQSWNRQNSFFFKTLKSVFLSVLWTTYVTIPITMTMLFRQPDFTALFHMHPHYRTLAITFSMSIVTGWVLFSHKYPHRIIILSCLFVGLTLAKNALDHLNPTIGPFLWDESVNLSGKIAVVTGANAGIGYATAFKLWQHGAHVILACRNMTRCHNTLHSMPTKTGSSTQVVAAGSGECVFLDLDDLESAFRFTQVVSESHPQGIHFLVANAGSTPSQNLTKDGFEQGFGGMHLGHMVVALGLLPLLRRNNRNPNDPSRIIIVSSEMAISSAVGLLGTTEKDGVPFADPIESDVRGERIRADGNFGNNLRAYGRAKLCNILFAFELHRRVQQHGWDIIVHSLHPGAVVTKSSASEVGQLMKRIPFVRLLMQHLYLPLLWRSTDTAAKLVLAPILSAKDHREEGDFGGYYLDGMGNPYYYYHDNYNLKIKTKGKDHSPLIPCQKSMESETVSFHIFGKKFTIFRDPVRALQVADERWSGLLWNVSLTLLENTPAKSVVQFAP